MGRTLYTIRNLTLYSESLPARGVEGFLFIMAKELPYFKFEPAEWEAGTIQMLNRQLKGLFIDLCSLYWIRLGELPYALALQKLCNGNADELQELCNLEIIVVNDSQIIIEFLDEQLNEFQKTSEKRAFAANKRWKNASALQVQSKSNAIREDKIRKEKSKEDNKIPAFEDFKNYAVENKPTVCLKTLKLKYDSWVVADWNNGNGKKIKNWKSALLNTLPYIKESETKPTFTTNR